MMTDGDYDDDGRQRRLRQGEQQFKMGQTVELLKAFVAEEFSIPMQTQQVSVCVCVCVCLCVCVCGF